MTLHMMTTAWVFARKNDDGTLWYWHWGEGGSYTYRSRITAYRFSNREHARQKMREFKATWRCRVVLIRLRSPQATKVKASETQEK